MFDQTTAKVLSSVAEMPAVSDYLRRIGGRATSFKTAVVEKRDGKYDRVLATIRFTAEGEVSAPEGFEPTAGERESIAAALKAVKFPTSVKLVALHSLPLELTSADSDSLFEFHDAEGRIVMLQQRVETVDGKSYLPWTYWSDGVWRKMEPEGPLPVWGLGQLKDASTVFIHEGAKAARAIRAQLDGDLPPVSPWLEEMRHAAHIGWIGGAHSVHRTDWEALRQRGIKQAYIVADNDAEGRAAVPTISRELGCPAFHVQFSQEWPESFDLADPFPEQMFGVVDGERIYCGPSFLSALAPATWATNETIIPATGRGQDRRVYSLRSTFLSEWVWVEAQDVFVHKELCKKLLPKTFNASVRPFSHVRDTTDLLQRSYDGQTAKLTYRPDLAKRIVIDGGQASINMFRPTYVRAAEGDAGPWLDFLAYLFPDQAECAHVQRWAATLIAHPEVRMLWGLLLISERQGIGKTTLATVLKELVGAHNTSFPGQKMILSEFTGWVADKRLVVVNEIYDSQNFTTYNTLKTFMTDEFIEANEKHMKTVTIPNWSHYIMCSNHKNALKIETSDRRLFVPTVAEVPWPQAKFDQLHDWLATGGYGRILAWAKSQKAVVGRGEKAPDSAAKDRIIEESMRPDRRLALDVGAALLELGREAVFYPREIKEWIAGQMGVRAEDNRRVNDGVINDALRDAGLTVTPRDERFKVGKVPCTIVANFGFTKDDADKLRAMLRDHNRPALPDLLDSF